ncbi:GAF and ANTAR domain-containing protein [Pedococcus sp. KACC 23699]|uniref:GAF and ANTAR domain-containing protein n=1 Tax=Pedococcus sp. KACC 23699 TaxID=3149228 RepID=A0AAU7JQA2_9MICO
MVDPTDAPRPGESLDLAAVYAELQNLLLDSPAVADFLDQLASLSVGLVSGSSCGITMRRDRQVVTAAHSDDFAMLLDNVQYSSGQGPCLQALHTGRRVDVPDLAADGRWPKYRDSALANGVGSSVSLPLRVNGDTVGALNLYNKRPHTFTDSDIAILESYAQQAAIALALLLRQAHHEVVQREMLEGVATRALIDQAIGILMAQRKVTASEALAVLREQSQNSNRKVSSLATELIRTTTGHEPEPPRPFTLSGPSTR